MSIQQHLKPLLAVLALVLAAASAALAETRAELDFDGILKVDGERTFVLGCYENPGTDEGLAELADAGFNLVHAGASAESLDKLAAHGLFGWVGLGRALDFSEDADQRRSQLTETVEKLRSHPALLVWEGPDEALWSLFHPDFADDPADKIAPTAAGFRQGYHALKQLDPDHPLWFNHACRNTIAALAEFNRACDIGGCDIYPVPPYRRGHSDLGDRSLACVGKYTERMKQAGEGDPVWMVLQGFGWGDLRSPEALKTHPKNEERDRRPRYDETRFMAYDAIVHGAAAILYWGTAYVEKDSDFWAELKMVVSELAALRPLWEAPTLSWCPMADVIEDGASLERRLAIVAKRCEGALYLIVVNESDTRARFSLHGMDAYEGASFHELFGGDALQVRDGALADAIDPYHVTIYTNGTALDEKAAALPRGESE